jgi:hypothetical protein
MQAKLRRFVVQHAVWRGYTQLPVTVIDVFARRSASPPPRNSPGWQQPLSRPLIFQLAIQQVAVTAIDQFTKHQTKLLAQP